MAEAWKCPKCGGTQGVEINVRLGGWRKIWRSADGHDEVVSTDSERWGADPKSGRCIDCDRIVSPIPELR